MGGDESFRIIPSPLARYKNFPGTRLNFYAFLRTFSLLSSSSFLLLLSNSPLLFSLVAESFGRVAFSPFFPFFSARGKRLRFS